MIPILQDAINLARKKKTLPTVLSSKELREALAVAVRERSIFSARTVHGKYLGVLHATLIQLLEGKDANGAPIGIPEARLRLKWALNALQYDPAHGFGLPEEMDIPPAMPGGLTDLGSRQRLDLILKTQWDVLTNAARRTKELEPERVAMFPAWQLVRIETKNVPRGFRRNKGGELIPDPEKGWQARFKTAGATGPGAALLMAWKVSNVWNELGSVELFNDSLGTNHPPFAFNSGMGWREVPVEEATRILGAPPVNKTRPMDAAKLPPARASEAGLPPATVERLKRDLAAVEAKDGVLSMDDILKRAVKRAKEARPQ